MDKRPVETIIAAILQVGIGLIFLFGIFLYTFATLMAGWHGQSDLSSFFGIIAGIFLLIVILSAFLFFGYLFRFRGTWLIGMLLSLILIAWDVILIVTGSGRLLFFEPLFGVGKSILGLGIVYCLTRPNVKKYFEKTKQKTSI